VVLAYESYGELAPDRGNTILACHALSGDAHAAGWSTDPNAPSAVDGVGADEKGIPARGGSKGIPRKNLVDVAGKPLGTSGLHQLV